MMHCRIIAFLVALSLSFGAWAQERTLDYYISQGLQNSPLLNEYHNQIKLNIQDSLLLKAASKPAIDATGQILSAPRKNNFGYDEAITNGGNYSAVVGVSQNMFGKSVYSNQYSALNIQSRAAANNAEITQSQLTREITDQYLVAYAGYTEWMFSQQVLSLLIEEEIILKTLTENGIYQQVDFFNFRTEKKQQQIEVGQLYVNFRQELFNLNFLCGINDTAFYALGDTAIEKTEPTDAKANPYFLKFTIDSLILQNSMNSISLRYRPSFQWFADVGINSISPWQSYKYFGFSVGLNFSVPIYDGNQKALEMSKLTIADDTRKKYADFYKTQYSVKYQQIVAKIDSYNPLLESLKEQVDDLKKLIEMNRILLEKGEISVTDYILSVRNYSEAKHQLILMKLERSQMVNELNNIGF